MNLDPVYNVLIGALVGALTTGIAALPNFWRYLLVRINGADVLLLRNALDNKATVLAPKVETGAVSEQRAISEIMDYARTNLPDALARLKVPADTLETMAAAALARAILAYEAGKR